jgi:hypothetical protein
VNGPRFPATGRPCVHDDFVTDPFRRIDGWYQEAPRRAFCPDVACDRTGCGAPGGRE